jgi:hypothetical protein
MRGSMGRRCAYVMALVASMAVAVPPDTAQAEPLADQSFRLSTAAAFDVSPPLRDLAKTSIPTPSTAKTERPERGHSLADKGHSADSALQDGNRRGQVPLEQISPPRINFEGVANSANPRLVSPPDPDGDVGPKVRPHTRSTRGPGLGVCQRFPGPGVR